MIAVIICDLYCCQIVQIAKTNDAARRQTIFAYIPTLELAPVEHGHDRSVPAPECPPLELHWQPARVVPPVSGHCVQRSKRSHQRLHDRRLSWSSCRSERVPSGQRSENLWGLHYAVPVASCCHT